MKVECQINKIRNALITAERMTGKNLTLPVLGSVFFEVKNKTLKIRATNLNIGIEIEVPAKIIKEGSVAIRGDVLSSLFSNLPPESNVYFDLINGNLSVKTKTSTILIKSIPSDDFPTIPVVSGLNFTIPSRKLVEGIKAVYYGASISDIKPEINSIYFYPNEDMLIFVSTDSFRLAEKKVKIKQKLSFDGIIIPYKSAVEIMKVFDDIDDDINISIHENQIAITGGGIYFTSRITDGTYPDYKLIIPKKPNTEAVVLKQDLISSLKVSNVFSDRFNQVTMKIKPSEKVFEIESNNQDVGENITILAGALSGDDVSANFNYKYILDCFSSVSTDSVTLSLSGNNKPMVIKPIGDASFMYLVMPMNR